MLITALFVAPFVYLFGLLFKPRPKCIDWETKYVFRNDVMFFEEEDRKGDYFLVPATRTEKREIIACTKYDEQM